VRDILVESTRIGSSLQFHSLLKEQNWNLDLAIACRPNEVNESSAVVTSAPDTDAPFGSDTKPLHRLLYLEKNKAGRKKEEGTSTNQVHGLPVYYLP
jgi:hypothetical protein